MVILVPASPAKPRRPDKSFVDRNHAAAAQFQRKLSEAIERRVDEGFSYSELSVDQLASDAGVSRSTFYKYFGDKTGLLSKLVSAIQEDFLETANAWLKLSAEASISDYQAAFDSIFQAYRSHRIVMRCIVEEADQNTEIRELFDDMMANFVRAVEQHIQLGQAAQTVTSDRPATELAQWLTWMLEFGQLNFVGRAPEDELDGYVAAAANIVWMTLYSKQGSR